MRKLAAWLVAASLVGMASGKTWTVCPADARGMGCDFVGDQAISAAIARAASGDRVRLRKGRYTPTHYTDVPDRKVVIRAYVLIDGKDIALIGEPGVVLDGSAGVPTTAILVRHANVTIQDLEIAGFRYDVEEDETYDGHGIYVIDGRARIERVRIRNFQKMALTGRGSSLLDVSNLQVLDGHVGVWLHETAYLRLRDSLLSGNDMSAIAAYDDSAAHVSSSILQNNRHDGVYAEHHSAVFVADSRIVGNQRMGANSKGDGRILLRGSTIAGNVRNVATQDRGKVELESGTRFQDCADCPNLVVIPGGTFEMGAEDAESVNARPRHTVSIRPFAAGVFEVTRAQFRRYVEAGGEEPAAECQAIEGGEWKSLSGKSWRDPTFAQTDQEPVICVSRTDARRYTEWLSRNTGRPYRLLSEAEWEYLASAGEANPVTHETANYGSDDHYAPLRAGRDQWEYTAPVGSFPSDKFGVHDVLGNVWEWLADCYHENYSGAASDGSARLSDCSHPDRHAVRGGGWRDPSEKLRPAYRLRAPSDARYFTLGFRIARDLE